MVIVRTKKSRGISQVRYNYLSTPFKKSFEEIRRRCVIFISDESALNKTKYTKTSIRYEIMTCENIELH